MGCHLLEILIPAVISAFLLWEGAQCRNHEYRLEVPSQVTVQKGLCLHIPCSFTYTSSPDDRHAELYGYWYATNQQSGKPRLVATNHPEHAEGIDPQVRHRFELIGPTLNVGDCSLTINDAEAADQATYHFRMEKGRNKYSYSAADESSSVTVTERKVDIVIPEPLRAGRRTSITCKTERCPSLAAPKITWSDSSQISILRSSQIMNHYSVESHLEFIPSVEDHQQNVTCKVTYGEESRRRSIEKTVTLDVRYPPKILPFNVSLQTPDGHVRYVSDVHNNLVFARVNESLLVSCEADANPAGSRTWRRIPNASTSRLHISNNELKITGLGFEDKAKYMCQARNQEGVSRADFYLVIKDHDNSPTPEP